MDLTKLSLKELWYLDITVQLEILKRGLWIFLILMIVWSIFILWFSYKALKRTKQKEIEWERNLKFRRISNNEKK